MSHARPARSSSLPPSWHNIRRDDDLRREPGSAKNLSDRRPANARASRESPPKMSHANKAGHTRAGAPARAAPMAPQIRAAPPEAAWSPGTRQAVYVMAAVTCLAGTFFAAALCEPFFAIGCYIGAAVSVAWARKTRKPASTLLIPKDLVVPRDALRKEDLVAPPKELDKQLEALLHPERFSALVNDVTPSILMTGPPGTGKTACVRAAALRTQGHLVHVRNTDFASYLHGESEHALTKRLDQAQALAQKATTPVILFLDELDLFIGVMRTQKTDTASVDRRVLDVLLQFMDGMTQKRQGRLIIIACTNKPEAIDPALASRFNTTMAFALPDASVRRAFIAKRLESAKHKLTSADITWLAQKTATFNFRELGMILSRAAHNAAGDGAQCLTSEHVREAQRAFIQAKDSEVASNLIVPLERLPVEELIDPPQALDSNIALVLYPERYKALVLDMRPGLLMTGPPGTGKTASVRAAALRLKANLVHLKSDDFLSKYYGETESKLSKRLDQVRTLARTSDKPTILFIDELDLMVPNRSTVSDGIFANGRILDIFLQFMDGLDRSGAQKLAIIACTNKPEALDAALASRFGASIEFELPVESARRAFCASRLRRLSHALSEADIVKLAEVTPTYNYRDLQTLLSSAGLHAVADNASAIAWGHIMTALRTMNQKKMRLVAAAKVHASHFAPAVRPNLATQAAG